MKQDSDVQQDAQQWNTDQIEQHLKSAVDTLTPHIWDKLDLSVAQDVPGAVLPTGQDRILNLQRRMRGLVLAAAACLCLVIGGGGAWHYQYQNRQIDSIIGIDVNPSVELSINRKNRVLQAQALNADAEQILSDMDLKGTELNVAVNAVIGAMVTQGYLDDLDNAILVTVSNDSIRKASELRTSVVGDIEKTLEENQVQAVVYDQQVIEKDELKALAEQYGISYGKAYFLQELIEQNQELTMDDMEELSSMTMEQIAGRIADHALALGEFADKAEETKVDTTAAETTPVETTAEETTEPSTEETSSQAESTTVPETPETTKQAETTTEEAQEPVQADRVKIDYVDYEDGQIYVCFVTNVKWKNPTVSVQDDEGNAYAAYVDEMDRDECTISVSGLERGRSYTFVLGGLTPREGGSATTVKGYFDVPEIAGELTGEDDEEEPTTQANRDETESSGSETTAGDGKPEIGTSGSPEQGAEVPTGGETPAEKDTTGAAETAKTTKAGASSAAEPEITHVSDTSADADGGA
ncbi:MAG: hypothetical protein PHV18_11440 [Lachnospiraceae bacterium]|nr:hypothetical protein [Lachnospiraceae bacterium]